MNNYTCSVQEHTPCEKPRNHHATLRLALDPGGWRSISTLYVYGAARSGGVARGILNLTHGLIIELSECERVVQVAAQAPASAREL